MTTTTTSTTTTTPDRGRVLLTSMILDLDMTLFATMPELMTLPPEEIFSYSWAQLHRDAIKEAVASLLGLSAGDVLLDLAPVDERGGNTGSAQGPFSPFAFKMDLLVVLPRSPEVEGLPSDATEEQVDATDLERQMRLLMGPDWAGGGLSQGAASGNHLFSELSSALGSRGEQVPAGLAASDGQRAGGGTAVITAQPSIEREYLLPITTTVTTTTTTTLAPCLTAPRPSHSVGDYTNCVGLEHLGICEVTCETGYKSLGHLVCKDGDFVETPSPVCVIKECPAPLGLGAPVLLPDGSALVSAGSRREDLALLTCSGLVYQSVCGATCNFGYVLDPPNGGSNLTCSADGNFTGNATCVPFGQAEVLRCHGEVPQFPTVEPARGCKGLWHGENCSLFCKSGYTLSGASALVCDKASLRLDTDFEPKCAPSSCGLPPEVPSGGSHANCSNLPHGSVCVPRCLEGTRWVFGQIICEYGEFRVTGKCVREYVARMVEEQEEAEQAAAETGETVEPIVKIDRGADFQLDVNVNRAMAEQWVDSRGEASRNEVEWELFDFEWALKNRQPILDAVSEILVLDPSLIEMDIFPLESVVNASDRRVRRLAAAGRALQEFFFPNPVNGSFRLRLRFFLPQITTTTLVSTTTAAEVVEVPRTQQEELVQLLLDRFLGLVWVPAATGGNATGGNGTGGNATGYYAPGFFHAIATQLTAQGLPIPGGLTSSGVAASRNPVFLEDLVLFTPRWLVDEWGDCQCFGGPNIQTRAVTCAVDHLASCEAIEEEPITEQVCLCPTPPPPIPWLGIPDEMKAGVGAGGLVGICCLAFCCCECRRFCKSTHRGKKKLRDQNNVSASYIVQDPSRTPTADGKVHVVWDVAEKSLQTLFPKYTAQGEAGQENPSLQHEEAGDMDTMVRENSADTDVAMPLSPRQEQEGQTTDLNQEARHRELLLEACPMYQEGERIEYWSKTHQCWLPGIVKITFREADDGVRAAYNVRIGRGTQWRTDTAIDILRLPLQQADPVEIWSKRGQGVWMPAAICGMQASSATTLGYRVQLDETGEASSLPPSSPASGSTATANAEGGRLLEKVPAARLRRLFPPGCPVEVYRGPPRGWVPAVVANTEVGEERHPAPLSPHSPGAEDGAPGARSGSGTASRPRLLHPWVMVPISEELEGDAVEAGRVDLVASYLLRLRTLYVLQQSEQDRLLLF